MLGCPAVQAEFIVFTQYLFLTHLVAGEAETFYTKVSVRPKFSVLFRGEQVLATGKHANLTIIRNFFQETKIISELSCRFRGAIG